MPRFLPLGEVLGVELEQVLVVGRQVQRERAAEVAGLGAHGGRHPLEQRGEHGRGAVQVLGEQERQAVLRDEHAVVLQCALAVGEELARVQHGAGPIGSELSTMMASKLSSVSATYLRPSAMTTSARLSSNTLPAISG